MTICRGACSLHSVGTADRRCSHPLSPLFSNTHTRTHTFQVRWADLEAAKEEQRKKEMGFCIGGGWSQVTAEEAETILSGKTSTSVALQPP